VGMQWIAVLADRLDSSVIVVDMRRIDLLESRGARGLQFILTSKARSPNLPKITKVIISHVTVLS
jgi:hypothetical protein